MSLVAPSAPREDQLAALLASSPPRRVPEAIRRAAQKQAAPLAAIIFGAVFTVFGMVFVLIFLPWELPNDWKIDRADAATAEGRVLEAKRSSMSINKVYVWEYVFTFQPQSGAAVSATCYTTGQRWQPGDQVEIRYRPEEPSIARIEGARRSQSTGGVGFVLLFPAVGLFIIVATLLVRRRAAQLLQHGTLGEALVHAVDATLSKNKKQTTYRIALRGIEASGGREFELNTQDGRLAGFAQERLESKQPVFLLYNPAKPKRLLFPETLHW